MALSPAKVPKVTISGLGSTAGPLAVVLGGRYGVHAWPQQLGVEAPRVVWQFPSGAADALLAVAQSPSREVVISATDSQGQTKTIQRVYVIGEDYSPDQQVRSVVFTDVRYYLKYAWVRAQYNIRVPSGSYRQTVTDGLPAYFLPKVSNLIYAPCSLYGSDSGPVGIPWTSQQLALDIINRACTGHDFNPITVRQLSKPITADFRPSDVYVDARADNAVAQALAALTGLDIRVADDGAIEIINSFLGAEKATVDPIYSAYSLQERGTVRWVSMSGVAPRAGKVMLTRRVELRVDSLEPEPGFEATGDDGIWGLDNNPTMINCIPVTDPALKTAASPVKAVPGGNTVVMGELLPVDAYCAAIAAANDLPGVIDGYTIPVQITRSYLLQGDSEQSGSPMMGGKLEKNVQVYPNSNGYSNVTWAMRVAAIKAGLRAIYKLNPVLARQCVPGSIKAERAGLLDAATATRQPAIVFMDYTQRPDSPGYATTDQFGWAVNGIPSLGQFAPPPLNQQSFPGGTKLYGDHGPYQTLPFRLSDAIPAPFTVEVVDPTIGVIIFRKTVNRELVTDHVETIPTLLLACPGKDPYNVTALGGSPIFEMTKWLLTHRVACVISAVPLGPNNNQAFQTYSVTVANALARLGASANAVNPLAPTLEMRIPPGQVLARIPWDDDKRADQLACFNNTPSGGEAKGDPSTLVPINDAELSDFATSVFAAYMAACLDHYEGDMTIGFTPGLAPVGSLTQVQHVFTQDGKFYTTLRARGVLPAPNPENIMSQASRNILFGRSISEK